MIVRHANVRDLDDVTEIELLNFGKGVAISRDVFEERLKTTPDTFLVIENNGRVVAYIEGVVVEVPILTDELFHQARSNPLRDGYIAITSLSVSPTYKGQGLGTTLLAAMKDLAIAQLREGIILTCEDYLISYYEMNGFTDEGVSQSQHGGKVWYQMSWRTPKS